MPASWLRAPGGEEGWGGWKGERGRRPAECSAKSPPEERWLASGRMLRLPLPACALMRSALGLLNVPVCVKFNVRHHNWQNSDLLMLPADLPGHIEHRCQRIEHGQEACLSFHPYPEVLVSNNITQSLFPTNC